MKIKNNELLEHVESEYLNKNNTNVKVGDTVKLGIQIKEGEKTRIQAYEGVVISKKNSGINKTITVRKIMQGIGVERCFLLNSTKIEYLEV
jgi:large subunit ribosomal protein L19